MHALMMLGGFFCFKEGSYLMGSCQIGQCKPLEDVCINFTLGKLHKNKNIQLNKLLLI